MYKIGDVVSLQSGGPKMTVYKVDSAIAYCVWFNSGYQTCYGEFPQDALKGAA